MEQLKNIKETGLAHEKSERIERENTKEENISELLNENAQFIDMEKKINKIIKQLEYSHPKLNPSERLQKAAKMAVAKYGNPLKEVSQSTMNRAQRRWLKKNSR